MDREEPVGGGVMEALNSFAQAVGWVTITVVTLLAVVGVLAAAGRGLDVIVGQFRRSHSNADTGSVSCPQVIYLREPSGGVPGTTSDFDARSAGESR